MDRSNLGEVVFIPVFRTKHNRRGYLRYTDVTPREVPGLETPGGARKLVARIPNVCETPAIGSFAREKQKPASPPPVTLLTFPL